LTFRDKLKPFAEFIYKIKSESLNNFLFYLILNTKKNKDKGNKLNKI